MPSDESLYSMLGADPSPEPTQPAEKPTPEMIAAASRIVDDFTNCCMGLPDSASDLLVGLIVAEMMELPRATATESAEDSKRVQMIRDAEWITSPNDGVLSMGSWRLHMRKPSGGQTTVYGKDLIELLDNTISAMQAGKGEKE